MFAKILCFINKFNRIIHFVPGYKKRTFAAQLKNLVHFKKNWALFPNLIINSLI